jgi:beta-lactamase superfamily II metal-dependent hydrolase
LGYLRKVSLEFQKDMKTDSSINNSRRRFLYSLAALGFTNEILFSKTLGTLLRPDTEEQKILPDWQEGYLDIHHISTGRGNAAFIICPDSTTILIDAGDIGTVINENYTPPIPNSNKNAGEWIAEYIVRFSIPLQKRKPSIDYAFLTHFHPDHIGSKYRGLRSPNGYVLSGIAEVAEYVEIKTIIDRGYPLYNYPSQEAVQSSNKKFFNDYLKFIEYQQYQRGSSVEILKAGSNSQFVLKNNPSKYTNFSVQNIYVNGQIWTGQGTETRQISELSEIPNENHCSGAIKLHFGKFSYFSGGDCYAIEKELSEIVGKTTVLNVNHHGCDSPEPEFLKAIQPQVMILSVWHQYHPKVKNLNYMIDRSIYPGKRFIFATALVDGIEKLLGRNIRHICPQGHITVRVTENGSKFRIYVLDAFDEIYKVKYFTNEMKS